MMSGGDPSFLDDSLWSTPEKVKEPAVKLGSSGEDPDMSDEDDLMMAGGDPSFFDDSAWGASPALATTAAPEVKRASMKEFAAATLGSSGQDPEMSEKEEILMSGGDPSFLDDSAWNSSPAASKKAVKDDEWDGDVDDSAHFDG